jgi:hypothetical protein
MFVLVPAVGTAERSGTASLMPVPFNVGAREPENPAAKADPLAPASTSAGANPVFITIDRVKPDVAVSGSIWAT